MSLINVGSSANDGTGDPLRTAFQKLNANVPRFYFANVGTAIENDTALTYSVGQMHSVSEGVVLWTQDGFRFEVLASGASEWDRETDSGVKLQALPDGRGAHSILQFGADTSKANNAPMLQKAIDRNYVYHLTAPRGEFEITEPIRFTRNLFKMSGPNSVGGGLGGASHAFSIRKTTSTEIDFNGTMVNAAFVMGREDDGYISHITFEDMQIIADTGLVEYGIYVPKSTMQVFKAISIRGFRIGFFTNDSWLCNWQSVRINCNTVSAEAASAGISTEQGWTQETIGVLWDGAGSGAGPGNSFTACWVRNAHVGWRIQGMGYAALNACGADQISRICYDLNSSILTLNGCGMENSYCDDSLIRVIGSQARITINNFKSDGRCRGNLTNADSAQLRVSGSGKAFLTGCDFSNFREPNASANVVIRGGGHLVTVHTRLPSNGSPAISYSDGSTWVDTTNGVTEWRNVNGSTTQAPPR